MNFRHNHYHHKLEYVRTTRISWCAVLCCDEINFFLACMRVCICASIFKLTANFHLHGNEFCAVYMCVHSEQVKPSSQSVSQSVRHIYFDRLPLKMVQREEEKLKTIWNCVYVCARISLSMDQWCGSFIRGQFIYQKIYEMTYLFCHILSLHSARTSIYIWIFEFFLPFVKWTWSKSRTKLKFQ